MSLRDRSIKIDILKKKPQQPLKYKQYDNDCELNLYVYKDNMAMPVTDYKAVAIYETPKGDIFHRKCTIDKNRITTYIDEEITSMTGRVTLEIVLTATEKVVTTFSIYIDIEKSLDRANAQKEIKHLGNSDTLFEMLEDWSMLDVESMSGELRNSNVIIDLQKNISQTLTYKQYDDGCFLNFAFYDNKKGKDLSGYRAVILYKTPDNTVYTRNCAIENNMIATVLDNNITYKPGKVELEIVLSNDKETISTFTTFIEVEESINRDEVLRDIPQWEAFEKLLKLTEDWEQVDELLNYLIEGDFMTRDELMKVLDERIDFTGYATENYVKNKILEAQLDSAGVDLSGLASKDDLPKKISELENDEGYLTEEDFDEISEGLHYYGKITPENDETIWFSSTKSTFDDEGFTLDNPLVNEIFAILRGLNDTVEKQQEEIRELRKEVTLLKYEVEYLKENGFVPGKPSDEENSMLTLEDGGLFLFEDGSQILLEENIIEEDNSLLELEDGGLFLFEDGGQILLEENIPSEDEEEVKNSLLAEDSSNLIYENGGFIGLETN